MFTKETVLKVARLARLTITDAEALDYQKQFDNILGHFQKISEAKTEGVEPLITPIPIEAFWREDVVQQNNTAEEILKNAPDVKGNLFKVPPVV
jgi:aspartyl-tRNA(Asn)/glutamyl-tRNA(Gln) amidotransferase subunit C